jgi:hypothetical protein
MALAAAGICLSYLLEAAIPRASEGILKRTYRTHIVFDTAPD